MEETWTILKVLQWTAGFFSRKGLEQPRANAEVLLAGILGMERVQLYLHFDKPLTPSELAAYRRAVKRRSEREPAQYITGKQEFWSLDFEVNPSVLIPRPETELLVMRALELLDGGPASVCDVGTGSGAVAVTLAHEHPRVRVLATDVSTRAIEVARRNAARHGVEDRILFAAMDLLNGFSCEPPPFDFVLSNPPYIGDAEMEKLPPEIRQYEPASALRGGGTDGLRIIRRIIATVPPCLKPGGWLLMEIGHMQAAILQEELPHNPHFDSFQFSEDYSGILRLLSLRRTV